MIQIVDHLKEPEHVLVRNLERVQAALRKGEKVRIYHMGRIHGRLADLPGVEYLPLIKGVKELDAPKGRQALAPSPQDKDLLTWLTTLQYHYNLPPEKPLGDIFIYWFYRERSEDRLSRCEIFHLNMLRLFRIPQRMGQIHVRCAYAKGEMTEAMMAARAILAEAGARVDFKVVAPNERWEHDTIKECVEYAAETGKYVYYTHFKGISRITDPIFKGSPRNRYSEMDIYYWTWLLYSGLFNSPQTLPAIGPMIRDGINKTYAGRDLSWSMLKEAPHHYAGSFQAFDGKFLRGRFAELGIWDRAAREKRLWVGDPYTVEMFLSLIFRYSEVYTTYILHGLRGYDLFKGNELPLRIAQFRKLRTPEKPVAVVPIEAEKAVITYLYGEHSILREPKVRDAGVAYICVTDNAKFKAPKGSAWQVIYDPYKEYTGRFRHMNAKFRPFKYTTAKSVITIDSSIEITGTLLGVFALPNKGILLKSHPISKTIREELPRWPRLRKMPESDVKRYEGMLPLIGASLDSPIYECDTIIWANTDKGRYFGEAVLTMVECAGSNGPFMSNQLCASALAGSWFSDIVGAICVPLPLCKYQHNTWNIMRRFDVPQSITNYCISHIEDVKKQFKQKLGYALNLAHPKTFCEKMAWLKVYDSTPLKTRCADKIAVREYVKEKTGEDLAIPLLGTYDNFADIDFKALPQNYVLKCNHGSGMNIIVTGGNLDKEVARKKVNAWMHTDYVHLLEFHYKPIPKKIFIEPYLANGADGLIDYKFWCFNGQPKFYSINAGHGHGRINYYDLNGAPYPVERLDYPPDPAAKWHVPFGFNQMVEYAKKLSADFKFVRVDFYAVNGRIYFGELTFIPGGGYIKFRGNGDEELGKVLNLQ